MPQDGAAFLQGNPVQKVFTVLNERLVEFEALPLEDQLQHLLRVGGDGHLKGRGVDGVSATVGILLVQVLSKRQIAFG